MLLADINKITLKLNSTERILLSNINFSLSGNSVYTIIGKNGTGKSTLIKSLTNLLDNKFFEIDGNVKWENIDLLKLNSEEILPIRQTIIRYVLQDSLNSLDALKKIDYYFQNLTIVLDELEVLLSSFQLPSYEKLKQMHSYELSGGMLQRLNLVLALAAKPGLLILDEPTSAIDSINSVLALKVLKDFVLVKNNSALIVTQDILFAQKVSDKVAFLDGGSLSEFVETKQFFESEFVKNNSLFKSFIELEN